MAATTTPRQSPRSKRRWSQRVTETRDALDLASGVFGKGDPAAIVRALKTSAEGSERRKSSPFSSAMSMLNLPALLGRLRRRRPKRHR